MNKVIQAYLALMFALTSFLGANVIPDYKTPKAVIPYVGGTAPNIDGTISPNEYDNFASITGMITMGDFSGKMVTAVPKMQQVVWHLGYDDRYMYISMRSPNPPDSWPLALTKKNDDSNKILWDDHVEIQIAKERSKATFYGKGFYKIMANAKGAKNDDWYYNSTPGTEAAWDITGPLKSGVTQEHWDLEMAIDIRAFNEKSFDGQNWVLQLLRADAPGGIYFAGWVGAAWMKWKAFGDIHFSRTAPSFKFLKTGELVNGALDLDFEITGNSDQATPVQLFAKLSDADGKILLDKQINTILEKGDRKAINIKEELKITDRDNLLEIYANYQSQDAGELQLKTLYHVKIPVHKLTDSYRQTHIEPWLKNKPAGDFDWNFSYWPSYGVAKSSIDVDFFGISKDKFEASAFKVEVTDAQQNVLSSYTAPIKNRIGDMILKDLDLKPGEYTAKVSLLSQDQSRVIGTRSMKLKRETFPWENLKIGVEDKVIAPYTPIQKGETKLDYSVTQRDYSFLNSGLLKEIRAEGGSKKENILRSPMRLEATIDGKTTEISFNEPSITKSSHAKVDMSSHATHEGLKLNMSTYLEYDGYIRNKLTLESSQGEKVMDGLRLVVPLYQDIDTMYMQRSNDARNGGRYGSVPEGMGKVWSSHELMPYQHWESFCPIVFLGNGDKGLWWFAEHNLDWTMSDDKAAVEVVRHKDGVDLVFNFFADKTTLNSKREIEFAFLTDPVRKVEDERQWAWGKKSYQHNTYGFRYWADSVDGFTMSDDSLKGLKSLLTDPEWKQTKEQSEHKRGHYAKNFRSRYYKPVGQQGEMMVLYGSGRMTGLGDAAFKTFGGEWLGKSNWTPKPETSFTDAYNMQGTTQWSTPEQLTASGINWTASFVDYFVYHHKRLLESVPVNGTWWDNVSIASDNDYDPKRGKFIKRFNVFMRRDLTKRLNHMGYSVNRRPWWVSNLHCDWSFTQVAWHIENDFYTDNEDTVMSDQLDVDEFRALCRIKRGVIHRLATKGPKGSNEQIRRVGRNAVGMCLLHDIGSYRWGSPKNFIEPITELLDETVDFYNGAEYTPYWRNDVAVASNKNVHISIYQGKGRAVLVMLNTQRGEVDFEMEIDPKKLLPSKSISRIYDAETRIDLNIRSKKKKVYPYEHKKYSMGMGDRALRLIVIE